MNLERIRDYVEGRLPPEEREAFASEISRDAALAEMVETYELIVRATADAAPAATTAFGDVLVRAGAERRWRLPAFAAAAVLLVAALAFLLAPRKPDPLVLSSIPLALLPAPEAPPDWPRELVAHKTADEEGLVWATDLKQAEALARAAKSRIFLFIDYPGCPLCAHFRAKHCVDAGVIKAADPYVLLNLPWAKAPPDLRADPNEGWPLFDLLDADGKRTDGFTGVPADPKDLASWLEERAPAPRPDWVGLGEGARKLAEAEREEDPARRYALYRQVAAASNVLGEEARARIAAMAKEAQDALFAARDAFGRLGSAAATDRLGAALAALRGTPYAADLDRVLAFLREHGSFPELKEQR